MNASEKNRLLGLLEDQNSTARARKDAIIALGAFEDDEEVVSALRAATNSGDESLRFYARRSLKRLGAFFKSDTDLADLLTTLSGKGEAVGAPAGSHPPRTPAPEVMTREQDRTEQAKSEVQRESDGEEEEGDKEPRGQAEVHSNPLSLTVESLSGQGKSFLEELERESNPQKLVYRIQMIAELEDATFIDPLVLFAYRKENSQVKATIVSVIGKFGDTKYLPIVESFLHHEDSRIRANAVEALGEIGSSESIQHILPFVTDGDNRIRANAAKALWKFQNEEVLEVLEEMVDSGSEPMRHSALYTLGKMSDDRARELLERLCDDNSDEISSKAEELISEMSDRLKMKKERLAKYKAIINEDAAGHPAGTAHSAISGGGSRGAAEEVADDEDDEEQERKKPRKKSSSDKKSAKKAKSKGSKKAGGGGLVKFLFKAAAILAVLVILGAAGLFGVCRLVPGVGRAVVEALKGPMADYGLEPGMFPGLGDTLAGLLIPSEVSEQGGSDGGTSISPPVVDSSGSKAEPAPGKGTPPPEVAAIIASIRKDFDDGGAGQKTQESGAAKSEPVASNSAAGDSNAKPAQTQSASQAGQDPAQTPVQQTAQTSQGTQQTVSQAAGQTPQSTPQTPQTAQASPQTGQATPQTAQASPQTGQASPQTGQASQGAAQPADLVQGEVKAGETGSQASSDSKPAGDGIESQTAPPAQEFKVKSQGDQGLIEGLYVTIIEGYNKKNPDIMFSVYHPEYTYLGSNLETTRKVTIEEFGYGPGLVMKIDTYESHIEGDRAKVRFSYFFEGEAAGGIMLDKEFSLTKRTDILLKENGKWLLKYSE